MRVLSLLAALVATAISSTDAVWPSGVKLAGLNYDTQRCYGEAVMIADLQAIARIAKSVRVYGLGTTGECSIMNLLKNAKNAGLTVGLGMWLDDKTNFDNQLAGLEAVIKTGAITSNVIGFHVGSEAIYRKDHTADQAIDYLKRTRAMFQKYKIDMKLTIADVVDMYYQYPQLLNAVDYVSINQFSFWEKVDPNVAMEKMLDRIRSIRAQAASQGKEVIISETGWASDGVDPKDRCSVPSVANQRLFFNNFYHQITAHGIPYYWFVAFDLPWNDKDGVTVERYFGVMNAGDRSIKASYQGVDFTPRNITTVQSSRGLLAETFNVAAPDEVKGVEITQYATDNLAKFRYQWFWDSGKKQFRSVNSDRCLDAYEPQNGGTVHTYTCSETNANQQWRYDAATQQIQHVTHAGFCLEDRVAEGKIQLWKCDASNVNQRWGFAAPPRRTCPKIDDDIDYLGNDIGSEKSATAEGCCSICASHAGCNAFSWNNFNGGTCWLKSAKGSITGKFGTRSAVIADVTPAPFTPAPTTPAPTTLAPTVTPVPTTTAPVTPVPTTTAPVTPVPTTTAPVTPTPSTCSTIEQNVDYIGNDLSSAASNTAGGCCDICKAKAGCKAFSWTNYQGGTCWLKTGKGQTAVSSGVLSAVVNSGMTPEPTTPTPTTPKPTTPAPTTGAPGACPAIENNIDYVGNDIGNALSATADGCCSICLARAGCNAFSWSDYMGGTCWLKSGKGQTVAKTGARSAVMRTGCSPVEVDVDYTGADVGNEKSTTADGCCTICRNNSKCKAYTWTDYMGGTCWLKSAKAGAKSATVL